MSKQRNTPPAYLGKTGRTWFRKVIADYQFDTAPEIELLVQAAATLDRIAQCRAEIAKAGMVVPTGSGGVKPHPCLNAERDNKILFSRICRELKLNAPIDDESNRLPRNR